MTALRAHLITAVLRWQTRPISPRKAALLREGYDWQRTLAQIKRTPTDAAYRDLETALRSRP